MQKFLFLFLILEKSWTIGENIAEVSYFDSKGKTHMNHIKYFIKPSKAQYGVKFGVNLYKINLNKCLPQINEIDEYFAAFVKLTKDCDGNQVLKEIQSHGADFVFLDMRENDNQKLSKNIYEIPVFILEYSNEEDPFTLKTNEKIFINIFFRMQENHNQKNNFVNVELFYLPSYEYSLKFLEVMGHVYHKLKDRILFEPHLVTFTSKSAEFIRNNCVGNGNYCAFDPDNQNQEISGKDVILESLREKCIYKAGIKNYFRYMKGFYKQCVHEMSQSCSEELMDLKGIDVKNVQSCVDNSFHKVSDNFYENENMILSSEKEKQKNSGLHNFPHILINGIVYEGSLSQDDLLMSLCASLHDETQECRTLDLYDFDDFSLVSVIVTHLLIFLFGIVIMAFLCKFIVKRNYQKKLAKKIGEYVTEYSNIKEEKNLVQFVLIQKSFSQILI